MAKRKRRTDKLAQHVHDYSLSRTMELVEFSNIHFRLTDEYTSMDIWPTTGRYYVTKTDYVGQGAKIIERGGEKGVLPLGEDLVFGYLDKIFFAADIATSK